MNKLIIRLLAGMVAITPLVAHAAPLAEPALSAPMQREDLIQAILTGNAGVEALRAAEQAAISRIEPAGSLDDPMLSTSVAPVQYGGNGEVDRSFGLELSQTLPWPGKLDARMEAAEAQSLVAGAETEIYKLKLRELAAQAWAEWAFVEQALSINNQHRQLLQELRKTAASQYAAGYGAQQDVLQADIERRLLEQRALELNQQRDGLQARINGLLNRSPTDPLPAPAKLNAPQPARPFERLADLARGSHPELARIEYQISADQARIELAEKSFYPDFRVSVGYNSMWDDPKHRPMIGLSVNLPLDQSKRRAGLGAAQAELMETRWRLIDRRSQLLAAIESARAATEAARKSYALYLDALLPLARNNLDAAIADYTAGRSDFINIISAERRLLNTTLGLARTLADYHRHLAELERAVGQPLAGDRPGSGATLSKFTIPAAAEKDHE